MQLGMKEEESDDASEGTMLHKCVEKLTIPDELSMEQASAVGRCIDCMPNPEDWRKEVKVKVIDHNFNLLTDGTVDAMLVEPTLVIAWDWKFGRNPVEPVERNYQMMAYALGLMQSYGRDVQIGIAQPRIGVEESYIFTVDEQENLLNNITRVIEQAQSDTLVLSASEEACRYCKAKGKCPAYQNKFEQMAIATVDQHTSELSTDVLAQYLDSWKLLKSFGTKLEHQAKERLLRGEEIDGWMLKSKAGSRVAVDAQGIFNAVQDCITLDQFMECITVSLPQLEEKYARTKKETDGITLKQAKTELCEVIAGFVSRKSDQVVLTKKR